MLFPWLMVELWLTGQESTATGTYSDFRLLELLSTETIVTGFAGYEQMAIIGVTELYRTGLQN
jgi:hypothetical protein